MRRPTAALPTTGTQAAVALTVAFLAAFPIAELWMQHAKVVPGLMGVDFDAYYWGARRLMAGEFLYDRGALTGTRPDAGLPLWFNYPAIYALSVIPFALLPFDSALLLWSVAGMIALIHALTVLCDELGYDVAWWWTPVGAWLLLGFQPVIQTLKLGQITTFIGATIAFTFVLLLRERTADPGVTTTFAALVKPFYLPICGHMLQSKRRLQGGLLALFAVAVAQVVLTGWRGVTTILGRYSEGKGWTRLRHPIEQWGGGYYEPWYVVGPEAGHYAKIALTAALAGYLLYRYRISERRVDDVLVFATTVIAVPILAPEIYGGSFAAVLPAILVLGTYEHRHGSYAWLVVLCIPLIALNSYWLAALSGVTHNAYLVAALQTAAPANAALCLLSAYRLHVGYATDAVSPTAGHRTVRAAD